jgi:hypothetical protein
MYTKGKMRPVETIPGLGRKSIKEKDGGEKFNYDMLLRNFVNVTIYPKKNNNKLKNTKFLK